jgi:hypothetical protein
MVQMVGGSTNCDVDRDRFSLELPTNHKSVVATYGIDLYVHDGGLHRRILGAVKG